MDEVTSDGDGEDLRQVIRPRSGSRTRPESLCRFQTQVRRTSSGAPMRPGCDNRHGNSVVFGSAMGNDRGVGLGVLVKLNPLFLQQGR